MENDKLENVCSDELRENFINNFNVEETETENVTGETDEQQNENNFNNNNDGRSSEEDEDELTRKIRAIPILPRIPKLKKAESSSGEIPRQQTLEHRSILQRKDSIINPDQSLKWPTESFGGFGPGRRINTNSFNKFSNQPHNHNGNNKYNNNYKNNSNMKYLNNSKEHNFNKNNHNKNFNLNNSKKDKKTEPQTTHMTYSSFKRSKQGLDQADSNQNLTSEEKFDQIFKKKNTSSNNLKPLATTETDNVFNNLSESDDFDCFDNNILNTIAKTPCKTIEDRYRERMQMGLKTAQMESMASCSKSDLTNNVDNNICNSDKLSQDCRSNANSNLTLRKSQTCPDSLSKGADTDNIDSSDDSKSSPNDNDKSLADKSGSSSRKVVTFNCPDANENSALLKNKKLPKKKKIDEVFCPKSTSQEKVVSIMKEFLKPYYSKQKITKDQYKEIMRKSVPKFSKIKPDDIKIDKIHLYAMKLLKNLPPRK